MHFPPIPRRKVLIPKIRGRVLINDKKKLIANQNFLDALLCHIYKKEMHIFMSVPILPQSLS